MIWRSISLYMAASVVKSCDLDHRPNHSGPGFITAPPSPHDSATVASARLSALWRGRYGGAASIWLGSNLNRICSLAHALHGRRPYLRGTETSRCPFHGRKSPGEGHNPLLVEADIRPKRPGFSFWDPFICLAVCNLLQQIEC